MAFDAALREYETKFCSMRDFRKEADEIESAVRELVDHLLSVGLNLYIKEDLAGGDSIKFHGQYKDLFRESRIVPVGSFPEGTKTSRPDEFDYNFVFIIDNIQVAQGCGHGKVKIILNQENKIWLQFAVGSNLKALGYHGLDHLLDNMMQLVEKEITNNRARSTIPKHTGTLHFLKRTYQRVDLLWCSDIQGQGTLEITVDIMPAISCDNKLVERFLRQSKFPIQYLPLIQKESCFLVPKTCKRSCTGCFNISFSTSELRLMYELDSTHTSCYKILKHFFSMAQKYPFAGEYTDITSYKLKNAIFHHVYEQDCNNPVLSFCLDSVLNFLAKAYESVWIPMFLLRAKCCIASKESLLYIYDMDYIQAGSEEEFKTDKIRCLIWFEFNRRLIQTLQGYLVCFSAIANVVLKESTIL